MDNIRFLDDEQRQDVGFNFILENLNIHTPFGIQEKKKIKPFKKSELNLLRKELNNIENIIHNMKLNDDIYNDITRNLSKYKDISGSIRKCKTLNTLDEIELYEIKNFSILINDLITIYSSLDIKIESVNFNSLQEISNLLDPENNKLPTFYIYSSYSTNLKKIRENKRIIEEKIFLEEDEEKIKILKEERLDIVIQEEKEELKIRKYLTEKINKKVFDIEENIKSLAKLDILIAKARLSIKYDGVKPNIITDCKIQLKNAFNPSIKEILEKRKSPFIPISISLDEGSTLITGANMGGKSVTLKTIVLNILLANMGFFVFCENAHIPILDFIYYISDDMQSINKGLSTFGAEVIKLKEITESIKIGNGFIALDEFARGTNPKEGKILAKALCEYLNKYKSMSVLSTHYDDVGNSDIVHYQVIGLKNINFDSLKRRIDLNKRQSIQIIQDHMDYRLEKVSVDNKVPKDALNISILLGLENEIVNLAKKYYEGE
ncbi:lysine 5,6-aminomutase reactivase ATPase KamC [Alkalithermobacter paradoxus]|uniref:lysine 5,6-aminomutase reactivase ATPase KamC n=1 Tax=Alkalithermobacter paradoxus TaxID=29349 RepID=UPI002F90C03E